MTNEVVTATTGILPTVLAEPVRQGGETMRQLWAWLAEKGATFALNVVAAIAIFVFGYIAIKILTAMVRSALGKSKKINKLFSDFICSTVNKCCWAVLIVAVLGRLGVNVGPLIAGLGVTGFILGFAFQESLANLAAGLMIAINAPFKVGDFIQAAGLEGVVMELNMMATVLTTGDNKKIVVPNKSVWGGPITNFTALGKRRVDMKVGIAYGADIGKAKAVARAAVAAVPGVLTDPDMTIEVASLDDSAVTLTVRAWAACADYWSVFFAAQQAVKEAFDANGVAIPFPQIDVHVKNT